LSASSTPPTTAAATPTTLSNNLYNNNHLYQHHNATTTLSGSGHNSKHSSGASAAISHHHPTPIEGLTALSSTTLHLTNSLCGGSSNSLTAAELGMSHWLTDGGSNSGETFSNMCGNSNDFQHMVSFHSKNRTEESSSNCRRKQPATRTVAFRFKPVRYNSSC
jgi:hypothetical protein